MKKFLLSVLFLITLDSQAASLRRCGLLPITDSVGGAIGYKVFENIEYELKSADWCQYVTNSNMLNVFSRYRENLPKHLKEKQVLKTFSEKLNVGSIIRITLENNIKGVELKLDVVGSNGEDIIFGESKELAASDVALITEQVQTWLDLYKNIIPYDAVITGVLGDQLTIDTGKGRYLEAGRELEIKRVKNIKRHPLLKRVVEWDTEVIGTGVVTNVSDGQALAVIKEYSSNKKANAQDWVKILPQKVKYQDTISFKDRKELEPGRLGFVSGAIVLQSAGAETKTPSSSPRMGGAMVGIDLYGEAWITRHYFAAIDLERTIGNLNRKAGKPDKKNISAQYGNFKLLGGYKYLPLGFFYGPQINLFAGYANYAFDLSYSKNDGFGKINLSGLMIGASANLPVTKEYRFVGKVEFLPITSAKDNDDIYGSKKNASVIELEAGLQYLYTPRMTLDAGIGTMAAKAKFNGDYKEIGFQENIKLKVGATFNF